MTPSTASRAARMDETDDATPVVTDDEAELNQLLGLFDVPAFARRGHDLEYALTRLHQRLPPRAGGDARHGAGPAPPVGGGRDRPRRLGATSSPRRSTRSDAARGAEPPAWAAAPRPAAAGAAVARDLVASVDRFNRRWLQFLDALKLDPVNRQIDQYNRYYVLEKECVHRLGPARRPALRAQGPR